MRYYQPERRLIVDQLVPPAAGFFLDIGCACGHVSAYLAQAHGLSEVGLEINTALLKEAQGYYPWFHNFRSGNGTALPFADSSFDLVVLREVLEHVGDEEGLVREVVRVLKPGGQLVMSVPNRSLISLLDLNRAKFYVPTLHRAVYWMKHRGNLEGFRQEETNHRHYSLTELGELLGGEFEIERHLYFGSLPYMVTVVCTPFLPTGPPFDSWLPDRLAKTFKRNLGRHSAAIALCARKKVKCETSGKTNANRN